MSIQNHIETFAKGWTSGDLDSILESLAPNFRLDDPNAGEFTKESIPGYVSSLKESIASIRDESGDGQPLMEMSEVVIKDDADPVTVWAWWRVPGTPISGSALVKITDDGVISERLAYYTKTAA